MDEEIASAEALQLKNGREKSISVGNFRPKRERATFTMSESPLGAGEVTRPMLKPVASAASLSTMRSRREIYNDPTVVNKWKNTGRRDSQNAITALYCKVLVLLGIGFPLGETLTDKVPAGYFKLFYAYLVLGSLLFLIFVYVDLVRFKAMTVATKKRHWLNSLRKSFFNGGARMSSIMRRRKSVVTADEDDIPRPKNVYGSLYLRMGAVMFGIGSMIHSGIEVGLFFETSIENVAEGCSNLVASAQPFFQICFVFVQMYFIFLNQKMNIYKNKFVSRLGLMHMIATNLCVWVNVLIMETKHEVLHYGHATEHGGEEHGMDHGETIGHHDVIADTNNDHYLQSNDYDTTAFDTNSTEHLPSAEHLVAHVLNKCSDQYTVMGQLLETSAPFLFPCTIEYSLICAAILYTMWKNIEEEHQHYKEITERVLSRKASALDLNASSASVHEAGEEGGQFRHKYSVDCSRANNGLFCGILVIVLTIISLIVFFVLKNSKDPDAKGLSVMVGSITEILLYSLTIFSVAVGFFQMRKLWYDNSKNLQLDNLLLVVAQTGVLVYSVFSMIGSFFQMEDHYLAFMAALLTSIQTLLQTLFILDASNRFPFCAEQMKEKPGREVVTFLLICNLAMWAINTLQANRADSHPIQAHFYGGKWVWPIITHVSMPLAVFYRFHSTVCLCEIWTHSFNPKHKMHLLEC